MMLTFIPLLRCRTESECGEEFDKCGRNRPPCCKGFYCFEERQMCLRDDGAVSSCVANWLVNLCFLLTDRISSPTPGAHAVSDSVPNHISVSALNEPVARSQLQ